VSHVSFLKEGALQANVVTLGTALYFGSQGNSGPYRRGGWSNPEDRGTWTDGPRARLTASLSQWPADDMLLEVMAHPFLVQDQHPSLQVEVVANDRVVDRWSYQYGQDKDTVYRSARIPASLLAQSPVLRIEFTIDQPAVPTVLGVHPRDNRNLGLFVSQVSFVPASSVGVQKQ
jgi:hypothetical protein